ncbi:hypothetical protein [Pseudomonas phage D6]|nr:hypothetical protein [Pseudomonas phage D6]
MSFKSKVKRAWFTVFARDRLKVADTIEKVIAEGFYRYDHDDSMCSGHMCLAARIATQHGTIKQDHYWLVKDRIMKFLDHHMFLESLLLYKGLQGKYVKDRVYVAWYVEYIKYLRGEDHLPLK